MGTEINLRDPDGDRKNLAMRGFCIALYTDSSLKRSGMARVNEGSHSFTCHPYVYPQVE